MGQREDGQNLYGDLFGRHLGYSSSIIEEESEEMYANGY
jgi:hypothetical protein